MYMTPDYFDKHHQLANFITNILGLNKGIDVEDAFREQSRVFGVYSQPETIQCILKCENSSEVDEETKTLFEDAYSSNNFGVQETYPKGVVFIKQKFPDQINFQ